MASKLVPEIDVGGVGSSGLTDEAQPSPSTSARGCHLSPRPGVRVHERMPSVSSSLRRLLLRLGLSPGSEVLIYFSSLESCPVAAATNGHKLISGTELYSPAAAEARSPTSGCRQGRTPSAGSGATLPCLFQLGVAPGVPRLWRRPPGLCSRRPCACLCVLSCLLGGCCPADLARSRPLWSHCNPCVCHICEDPVFR